MIEKPLVSVVMPVFNAARFVREVLESAMAQTYPRFEIVAVDGPSTDATAAIVQSFSRVRYLRQRGEGMWNALNEGVVAARGELIAFLSSDDLWHPDKLRLQVEALELAPDADYAAARVEFRRVEGDELAPSFRPELLVGDHVAHMPEVLMVRRRLLDRLGTFDERFRIGSDIDWILRLRDAGVRFVVVPQVLLYKRVHEDNLSTRGDTGERLNREILQIAREKLARRRRSSAGSS